jgi:transcription initiation factor TFIIH subunit 1
MTEKDFWTKFFQSHYFHRDRLANLSTDLFAECAKKDDEDLKLNLTANSSVADITQSQPNVMLEEGYGLLEFRNNPNVSNQNLIKRYNYYSMRILNSMEENVHGTNVSGKGLKSRTSLKMDEKLDDLDSATSQTSERPLKLTKVNRYFDGPISMNFDSLEINNLSESDFYEIYNRNSNELNNWKLNVKANTNPSAALSILKELTPSGELMNGSTVQNLNGNLNPLKFLIKISTRFQLLKRRNTKNTSR